MPANTPPSPDGDAGSWDRLRQPWYDLDLLASQARQDYQQAEETREGMEADHRAALDRLVADGAVQEDVADQMQMAFESATYHVWRLNAPLTCYESVSAIQVDILGSGNLAKQAEILEEMAQDSQIDPDTVELARTAIERDMAFLAMTPDDQAEIEQHVLEAARDGQKFPDPDLNLEIPPDSAQAARILVALLLGQGAE